MNDLTYTYPAEVVIERAAQTRRLVEERDALKDELERYRALVADGHLHHPGRQLARLRHPPGRR